MDWNEDEREESEDERYAIQGRDRDLASLIDERDRHEAEEEMYDSRGHVIDYPLYDADGVGRYYDAGGHPHTTEES